MADAIQYFRSLVYLLLMVATVILFASVIVLGFWMPFAWRFNVARAWSQLQLQMLRWLCGICYELQGVEHIPAQACVVYWKHNSSWETFVTFAMFHPQCWVVKRELLRIPLFGWALALINPIAIDRGGGHVAVQQVIEQGKRKLAQGIWVSIFPEGTRMPPGTTRKYGLSGALLAQQAGVPVLPVAHNAGDYWPRHSVLKKPGKIIVRVGPAIATAGRKPEDINRHAQDWIESQMEQISPHHAAGRRILDAPAHLQKKR